MHHESTGSQPSAAALATLKRFIRPSPTKERCELCSIGLPPDHRHLLEVATGRAICACPSCAMRFHDVVDGRFKLIPREVRRLPDFKMTDAEWDSLGLPINLAFFRYSTPEQKMKATYPSPAGATECLLSLDAWKSLVVANPVLGQIVPDVEALLLNRINENRNYFIVPIDVCFELVGLIRMHWKGLSGGELVWKEIANFFNQLSKRA